MVAVMMPHNDIYQRILDNLNSVVLCFSADMRLRYINPAGEMMFAVSARHLIGLEIDELMQSEDPLRRDMAESLISSHPITRHEVRMTLLRDREICVDMTVSTLSGPGGEVELLLELTRLDRLLRITRDEHLYSQQKATKELLRGLAHEVKNPLGGLRGAAQLLERELDSFELKEYTRVIIDEADRLQNLVDRLLGPNSVPKKREINIHEVLERVRSLVLVEITEGLNIQRDYDTSLPELMADPDMLIQAILNIVRNASQAMQQKGTIILKTRIERNYTIGHERYRLVLRAEVIDNGPGIDDEMKEKIFFPMVTGRAEGSGLGLSIAQSLIQQHNGIIECYSQPGCTRFSILLPILDSE
jgi:two-component system nitrogen regulation sensor histidine kinase GlnL